MPITFFNKQEALEYSNKMRREGYKTKIILRNKKYIVTLTGEREVYHVTPLDLGEEITLEPKKSMYSFKKKVSFAPSIKQSLQALPDLGQEESEIPHLTPHSQYTVYSPEEEIELIPQTEEEDFEESEEVASYKPIKVRKIGTISHKGKTYEIDEPEYFPSGGKSIHDFNWKENAKHN